MSAIGQTGATDFSAAESAAQVGGTNSGYNALDVDNFLTLLISELQNQDPLDPMDNSEMIQQIGLIREIGATDDLTSTLSGFADSQELVTASNLIGETVTGLASDSSEVSGLVDRVTVETDSENNSRSVKVHVGDKTIEVKNIREIQKG